VDPSQEKPPSEPGLPEKVAPPASARQTVSLLRSSGVVGVMTLLSRVLGLVRDIVVANLFGASEGADAFFVAFKIPNFLRRLFAEGAFSQAFVPVLSEYRAKKTPLETKVLIDAVAGSLGLVLAVITVLAMIASPLLAMVFAPGFLDDDIKFAQTVYMLRITFPYLLLISLTAFAGAILNSYDDFAVPALTPVLLNLSLIGAALGMTGVVSEPVFALAWGVLIAGVAQLLFQLPFLSQKSLLPMPVLGFSHPGVRRILKLMTPALFGVSVSQINLLLDTILASFLVTGSVSWLYYSDRLTELPLGLFGIAIATVILPSLSRRHADTDGKSFSATLDWGIRAVLLIGAPATLALALLSTPLISTLFQHGALTREDVLMSSGSLQAYSLGLLFFMLVKVLAPGYFARQDTRSPVRYGLIAMGLNMVFNLILIFPLAHVGLALATSLSAGVNTYLLARGLYKEGVYMPMPGWFKYLLQLTGGLLVLGIFIVVASPAEDVWLAATSMTKVIWLSALSLGGIALYGLAMWAVGIRLRHLRMRG
jgi:putative peptidoglycan lipid II flippase